MSLAEPDLAQADRSARRRRWLTILGAVVAVAVIGYAIYWFAYARYFESTDDSYVGGDVIAITAREPASVLAIHADNTQAVQRGQLLIEFDPTSATVAMQAAEADLARTVRKVRGTFATADKLRSEVDAARVALAQAESDLARRQSASKDGAVSAEEVKHAQDAVQSAAASLKSAQGGLGETLASIQGTSIANNPDVLAAIAQLRAAAITLGHMKLYAPVDGVVAQRTAQLGQQVSVGMPLMAVVPLESLWIDANFKEGQLSRMRAGQPVTATADVYGGSVTYHGTVEGLGAGSGSAFALLPPQNASGNWIKVVQRVPVRIALDPKDLHDHPLRVGLSMDVDVDVRDESGPLVTSRVARSLDESAPTGSAVDVDSIIRRILAQNGAASAP